MQTDARMHWQEALAAASCRWFIEVDGCPVSVREWQLGMPADAPLILLVHGQGAHSHWWDGVAAPVGLGCGMRVAALDLSSMGDSGHRRRYSLRQFAKELLQSVDSCSPGGPVILVAHSFGGSVARIALHLQPDDLSACVLLDSVPGRGRPQARGSKAHSHVKPEAHIYPSREEALRRFRLRPAQPPPAPRLFQHIANHSIRQVEGGGWQFKLDTRMRQKLDYEDFGDPLLHLSAARHKYAAIYGTRSPFFGEDGVDRLRAALSG